MSSEDSDGEVQDQDLPSAAECEQRCQRFAEVTGTDTALAMFFLQDRQWNLDSALNAFFEDNTGAEGGDKAVVTATSSTGSTSSVTHSLVPEQSAPVPVDPQPHRVRVLSWNIDGLETAHLKQRTKSVVNTIRAEKAEVVFLQEVVGVSEAILRDSLKDYAVICGGTATREGYYSAILLHKLHSTLEDFSVVPFLSSQMARNLLVVNCTVKGVAMRTMTSHLESTKSHAAERKRQLQVALKHMRESPPESTVVFGGDLNIRDKEVEEIGGLPEGISDMWEATGCRKEARYTWDTFRNDNLAHNWRTKLRFDRLFLRQREKAAAVKPVYFELVGLERVPGAGCFPSDHWGILTHFDLVSAANK